MPQTFSWRDLQERYARDINQPVQINSRNRIRNITDQRGDVIRTVHVAVVERIFETVIVYECFLEVTRSPRILDTKAADVIAAGPVGIKVVNAVSYTVRNAHGAVETAEHSPKLRRIAELVTEIR